MPSAASAFADVAPPGEVEGTLLVVSLAAFAVPLLFGLLIVAIARIHRNRSQCPSESARDDT
jgi:hypothetical protein